MTGSSRQVPLFTPNIQKTLVCVNHADYLDFVAGEGITFISNSVITLSVRACKYFLKAARKCKSWPTSQQTI